MHIEEVQNATIEELTAFYNANAKTPVEAFDDFPTAAKRVKALIRSIERNANKPPKEEEAPLTPEEEEARKLEISERRRAAVKASWENPETAAARSARTGVEVDGVYYRSVTDAYEKLGLPGSKCLAHRAELRANTIADPAYVDEEYGMVWKIVPYRSEKTPKAPKEEAVTPETDAEAAEATVDPTAVETV